MIVIQHPERVDPRRRSVLARLPVQPEEVHTFVFERMMKDLEVRVEERPIGWLKHDGLISRMSDVRGRH